MECNINCLNNTCNDVTGSCKDGCAFGKFGDFCNETCDEHCVSYWHEDTEKCKHKIVKIKDKNAFFLNLMGFLIIDRYVYLILNRTTSENNINTSNNDSFIIWIISGEQLWSGVIKSIIKNVGLHRIWSPPSVFDYPILLKKCVFFL